MNLCFLRSDINQQPCIDSQGEERHLLLNPQHCTLCEEYRDCAACTQVLLHPHLTCLKDCHDCFDPEQHAVCLPAFMFCKAAVEFLSCLNVRRTPTVSGRSTPAKREIICAVAVGDWKGLSGNQEGVLKFATSEFEVINLSMNYLVYVIFDEDEGPQKDINFSFYIPSFFSL